MLILLVAAVALALVGVEAVRLLILKILLQAGRGRRALGVSKEIAGLDANLISVLKAIIQPGRAVVVSPPRPPPADISAEPSCE